MAGSREDQWSVALVVDKRDLGVWDKQSGGEVDSEESKFQRGGMGPQVSLGGRMTVENVTCQKLYDQDEVHPLFAWLAPRVGKVDCTVTKQPLDINGNAHGAPIVRTGVLKRVKEPDADSESNNAALLEVEVSTHSPVV